MILSFIYHMDFPCVKEKGFSFLEQCRTLKVI